MIHSRFLVRLGAVLCVLSASLPASAEENGERRQLKNRLLRAVFDAKGLIAIEDKALRQSVVFQGDRFVLEIDRQTIDSRTLTPRKVRREDNALIYHYQLDKWPIDVVYELKPGWRFLSKHLRVGLPGKHRVRRATVLGISIKNPIVSDHRIRGGKYGAFLRFARDGRTGKEAAFGMFAVIQNPFLKLDLRDGSMSLAYEPDMEWSAQYGPFETDRVCLGTYALSGTRYPARMMPEWAYLQDPKAFGRDAPKVDINGTLAMTECVKAFTTYRPTRSTRMHVDWCENVYQIDVSTPAGWKEYQRIIKRAAQVGCNRILFTPHDEKLAPLRENRDAWGWESLLWLNMGQKVRKGQWVPGKDPLPPVVKQRLDFARKHGIRLAAYVYPTLPFMQDPKWTQWVAKLPGAPKPGGYRGADTGLRTFQDWLVKQLVAFKRQTGCGGFAFDHWWIAYPDSGTSKYAQWYGCRRVLLEVRKRCPDVVMDGRQQYSWFGPWTLLGGSYPHPLASDEQPQSFRSFPDLHWSRGSADRQRYKAWWYRMRNFTPVEVMPGYMMHQTMRSDAKGRMRRDRYRTRDFDYLGWKYSVISSIGTAPINHVVNYLPARDKTEFDRFPDEDCRWMRDWFDWTDRNIGVLRKLRPIIGQPMVGRCDGTAAIDGNKGFIFLFNPNYRRLDASFTLDGSIGLTEGKRFIFRQLYPDLGKGRLIGHPKTGCWRFGEQVTLPMTGASAMVLELVPLSGPIDRPVLLNSVGKVVLEANKLQLTSVAGEPGSRADLAVLLGDERKIKLLNVNGKSVPFAQTGSVVSATVHFAGRPFVKCQPIGQYDANFKARAYSGSFQVPKRIFEQLDARRRAWPIPYDKEELKATWTAPHRLLLFVNIADPKPEMTVSMKIGARAVQVNKAYSCVYPQAVKRTLLGFYADVSWLRPGTKYKMELSLPELKPGQFQGIFFENIEPESTQEIRS